MYTNEEALLYRKALRAWGMDLQMIILLEEMGELQQVVCKMRRGIVHGQDALNDLAEEIADVLIMLGQVMVAYDSDGLPALVSDYKTSKVARLKSRLEERSKNDNGSY